MHPTTATFARAASRPLFNSSSAAFTTRQAFTRASPFRSVYRRQEWSRRWQSSSAEGQQAQQSWFQRMWDSPVGLKTVHFWAPVMKVYILRLFSPSPSLSPGGFFFPSNKATTNPSVTKQLLQWALVLAGVSDFARPAEKLSLTQNAALTATGFIWTRWCMIITPKNFLLAAVNFFLGLVGVTQCTRILIYNSSQKDKTALDKMEEKVVESS